MCWFLYHLHLHKLVNYFTEELLTTDLRLAYEVYFGPLTPLQFRLTGPHSWPGASQAIKKTWDRVYVPLKTRKIGTSKEGQLFRYVMVAVSLYILFFWILGF